MNIQLIFTIWNLEEGQLKQWSTWISNQFSKFGTPIHKKTNLNLNLEEGQPKQFGTPIQKKQI